MIGRFWHLFGFLRWSLPAYPPDRSGWNWQAFRQIGIVRALCYWRRLLGVRIRGNRRAWFGCQKRSA